MGFSPIHKNQIIKTLDTSEVAHLGGYTMAKDMELKWVRLVIYKQGTEAGSEQIRLGVYSRSDLSGQLFTSDWVDVVDFVDGNNWIGFVRFDFDRQHLDADTVYHLAIETNNYTRNGDAFFLSTSCDWPDPVNTPNDNNAYYAAAAHFYGYQNREKTT